MFLSSNRVSKSAGVCMLNVHDSFMHLNMQSPVGEMFCQVLEPLGDRISRWKKLVTRGVS